MNKELYCGCGNRDYAFQSPYNTYSYLIEENYVFDNNLHSVIENEKDFFKFGCEIVYNDEKIKIIQSFIFQFDGTPLRSLLLIGYSNKSKKYVSLILTDSIKPYPPVYCEFRISEGPFIPNITPFDSPFVTKTINNVIENEHEHDKEKVIQTFKDILFSNNYMIKNGNDIVKFRFYLKKQ